jgi:hypothetical protein
MAMALILLAALFFWLRVHRPDPLWPGAVALESTRDLVQGDFIASGYDHVPRQAVAWFWRSASTLTCLRFRSSSSIEWIDMDIANDHRSEGSPGPLLQPHPPDAELVSWSPSLDGQWFLQISREGTNRIYAVFHLRGGLHAEWRHPYESHSHPEWLSDSSGFVEWPIREGQLLARVHWLTTGSSMEVNLEQLAAIPGSCTVALPQPFVLMTRWPRDPSVVAEFLVLDPIDQPEGWHRRVLPLPAALAGYDDVHVYAAPTGDHLAWLAHARSSFPTVGVSGRFPFLTVQVQHRTTLFVSTLDGTDLRRVGRTPAGVTLEHLQWIPESIAISFLHAGRLWIQPVL